MSFYTEGSVFILCTNGGSVNTEQKKTVFFFPSCIHYSCCFTLYPSIFICYSETYEPCLLEQPRLLCV